MRPIKKHIAQVLESVFEQDYVTVAPIADASTSAFVGKDLKATSAELEKRIRAAAAGSHSGADGAGRGWI
jgi:excinuclease ABC subunit B